MGSQIAAHFANAGISSLLLDIAAPGENKNALAERAIAAALRKKPNPFFSPATANLIEAGNFEGDLSRLKECDWIVEAVTEDLSIKQALWTQVSGVCNENAILSTNTSGLQIESIAKLLPPSLQQRFLGTHFFNPPRYLHLLELVPGAQTREGVVRLIKIFAEQRLGKGVVVCKDTPGFIANRVGCFYSVAVQHAMVDGDYSIEEADELTGPLLGMPKSASFRLIDIIGLDVWLKVAQNVYENTHDSWRNHFLPQPYANEMLARNWLGEKSGQGFYRRSGPHKQLEVLDWITLRYRPLQKPSFESVEHVRRNPDVVARVRSLIETDDRAGRFLWRVLRQVFAYCVSLIPEVSDRIVDIDRAMCWGFGHKLGPFELWDGLGLQTAAKRMEQDGIELPPNLARLLSAGIQSFYRPREYLDIIKQTFCPLETQAEVLRLNNIRHSRGEVDRNADASLIDLGDGVLCLEFHSKMNIIGDGTLQMMARAIEALSSFEAMVIANEGEVFSAGANLALLLQLSQAGNFAAIKAYIRRFQYALMSLKYAPKPVVAAAFSKALGGGCEVILQSHRVQALAELYTGLVELNVGLIPAGGGTKELAIRFPDPTHGLNLITSAKVSQSAQEAKEAGLLRAEDRITMNPEFLIGDAKSFALELAQTYRPVKPKEQIPIAGEDWYSATLHLLKERHASGSLSEHDVVVLQKLAYVLSGGRAASGSTVTEQQLLDLELEVFLSLCGMPKTQERIQHILQHGQPLKN